jgi:glutamate 5-kinase
MDGSRTDFSSFISAEKSNFGRGGMITKCSIAQKLVMVGIKVHIANGKTPGIISAILQNQPVGTVFVPKANQSKLKRWVANSEGYAKGSVVNEGARMSLTSTGKATSLLPVGITQIEGSFQKGDIIKIVAQNGQTVGLGMAQYSSAIAQTYLGEKNKKPLIHYDYLFLYD